MTGESFVFKSGRTFYYFHLYARTALLEKALPVWEEMLSSARRKA